MTSFDRNPNASHPERQYGPITDAHGIDQLLGDEFGSEQSHSQEDSKTIPWHDLEYIGAFAKCYLFFSTPDGRMLVLDQHAFHERVLFERLVNDETLLNQVQKMLMPEEIVLTGEQIESLILQKPDLAKRGFSFEQISDTSIEVSALPAILMGKNLDRLFSELAEPESATESTESNATMSRLILATIACHAAVRAGEELGTNELRILMNEAPTVDFYHVCPHGRRVFKWWNKRQIESWFDR